jgi:hypothetical protein
MKDRNSALRPPLWSSGQSSWLLIQRSRVRFQRYQIFWEVVGLERSPLSLVRIIEKLLEWKSSGSDQENRFNDLGDPLRWPRDTLYRQKLALTSPTSGGRSVGIVRLRTKGHGVYHVVAYTLQTKISPWKSWIFSVNLLQHIILWSYDPTTL